MAVAANAHPVDVQLARTVGVKFLKANTGLGVASEQDLNWVTTYRTGNGDAAFFVFNTQGGFVIVSADDYATPILGYSDEGQFDENDVPIQLQDYLQDFVEQIQYGIENHVESDEQTAHQWELVRTIGWLNENREGEVVEPLVSALWHQRCYYNAMCPEDPEGPCDHVLTGCVATAMGMILHYWGYPAQGTGSHTYTPMPYPTTQYPEQSVNFGETTYDWANMPDYLTDTSTQTEIAAVATLLWHCGVSVDMKYSPYGSGTDGYFSALIEYFGYSDDMHWESRQDDELWLSLLKTDLDHGRPVLYTGYRWANSGHAFVCDGYDVNDRFHFNWGWGGSSNGYFALNAAMVFVYDNDALFNIHPNACTTRQITASACPADGGYVSGAGMYNIDSICTLTAMANDGYTFFSWTKDGELVSTDSIYSFTVTEDASFVANFGKEQTITLSAGWNWFSTYVEITLDDLKTALVEAVAGTDITIKSKTQNTAYNPGTNQWRGTLTSFDVTQMYMINVSSDCEMTLVGMSINPAEHPVTISNGSNWIAFPFSENMAISDAFAGFAVNGDKVKSRNNNTQYLGNSWRGQLTTLMPGQGYMYISNTQETRTFTFPISTK